MKTEFEGKFVEYEICDNPDHGFIEVIPGDVSRIGCPLCGHDEEHRILITAKFNAKPKDVWEWIKLNFISKQKIQTALDKTSNWNCKEVLTKLLEDK